MVGSVLLSIALIFSLASLCMYYSALKKNLKALVYGKIFYYTTTIFAIAASILFLHAILTHQYQYSYIYSYSSGELPLGLLISSFFAGQEGSFLLWVLLSSFVGIFLQNFAAKRKDLEPSLMTAFLFVHTFLLAMVSPALKNPFEYIWTTASYIRLDHINPAFFNLSFIKSHIYSDESGQNFLKIGPELHAAITSAGYSTADLILKGRGLNPLLQNFWMQIHPPLLFVGFALSAVPYSFAMSALLRNNYTDWVKYSLPWLLGATLVLAIAIMSGGYWAYGILGWGGYWGWDPVENSSLAPWLIGTAAIHTMLVQKRTIDKNKNFPGEYVKTNLILSIAMFLLVVYSSFLTRSGILGELSVHSFTDSGKTVYLFLIAFILSILLSGAIMLAMRWKNLNITPDSTGISIYSRELALFAGALTLIASSIIILTGTSAPIFGKSVQIEFYGELNFPIAIIIGALNGFSLLLKWKFSKPREFLRKIFPFIALALFFSTIAAILADVKGLMNLLLTFSSFFALLVNVDLAARIFKSARIKLGGTVSHIGIAIFLLGVVATNGFSEKKYLDLVINEPQEVFGRKLTFIGIESFNNGKKYHFKVKIESNSDTEIVSPVMFVSDFNNNVMKEPDIHWTLFGDFYIEPVAYEEQRIDRADNSIHVLRKGESIEFNGWEILFESFETPEKAVELMTFGADFSVGANIKLKRGEEIYRAAPKMISSGNVKSFSADSIPRADIRIELLNLDASGIVEIELSKLSVQKAKPTERPKGTFIAEVSVKPFVILVWLGTIIAAVGLFISVTRRAKEIKI